MDENNQFLPIAYGVWAIESDNAWMWFLDKLKECIRDIQNLAIVSDRRNSIDLAVR